MQTIQPKIRKFPVRNFRNIWIYLLRLTSFPEIPENAVPFGTGNFRKLKSGLLVEWKASNEIHAQLSSFACHVAFGPFKNRSLAGCCVASYGSSRNGEKRLRDKPKERLRRRLGVK